MSLEKVRMYTKQFCGFCSATESICFNRNITIEKMDISERKNQFDLLEKYEKEHGYGKKPKTVPQIWILDSNETDWRYIGGYQEFASLFVPNRY